MTKRELYHLLGNPADITRGHIPVLEQLLGAYPYASSFVFLYLYALAKSEDIRYAAELKRLVAYLPNREHLFRIVHGYSPKARKDSQAGEPVEAFDLIDSFLEGARSAGQDLGGDLQFDAPERSDYFASERNSLGQGSEGVAEDLLRSRELPKQPADSPQVEAQDNEGLFTETLAKIYIQQGKYDRALRIIESLHLHYPEKNRYFAVQMRFLQRLVQNRDKATEE